MVTTQHFKHFVRAQLEEFTCAHSDMDTVGPLGVSGLIPWSKKKTFYNPELAGKNRIAFSRPDKNQGKPGFPEKSLKNSVEPISIYTKLIKFPRQPSGQLFLS